jgi:hypothetical protein
MNFEKYWEHFTGGNHDVAEWCEKPKAQQHYEAGRDSMQKELTPESLQSGIDDLLNENADLKAKAKRLVGALKELVDIFEDLRTLKGWEEE